MEQIEMKTPSQENLKISTSPRFIKNKEINGNKQDEELDNQPATL